MKRVNILISAAHILNCTTNSYLEASADILEKNGMMIGEVKKMHNAFVKCADRYFREFAMMIDSNNAGMDMFEDMESFDKVFRHWAKIEEEWEPIEVEYKNGKWMPVNQESNE